MLDRFSFKVLCIDGTLFELFAIPEDAVVNVEG
jgi:hypothetical protein